MVEILKLALVFGTGMFAGAIVSKFIRIAED